MPKPITIAACVLALAVGLGTVACNKAGPPPPKNEIEAALAKPNAVILDVRSPKEFASGHVPGAINLPVKDVSSKVESVIKDKDTTIIVHCAAGVRSGRATKAMQKLGYKNIVDAKNPKAVADAKGVPLTKPKP